MKRHLAPALMHFGNTSWSDLVLWWRYVVFIYGVIKEWLYQRMLHVQYIHRVSMQNWVIWLIFCPWDGTLGLKWHTLVHGVSSHGQKKNESNDSVLRTDSLPCFLCIYSSLSAYIKKKNKIKRIKENKKTYPPSGNLAHHHVGTNCRFAAELLHG